MSKPPSPPSPTFAYPSGACAPTHLGRRHLLQTVLGASTAWAAPMLWAQTGATSANANSNAANNGNPNARLVVVFLRGAYDGLSALVPYADANYYRLRPTIALPTPDGTAQTTLKLDDTFGLNPALAALLPLWQQGVLAAVPAAGSPDPTRSHFDAQHHWELGTPGRSSGGAGWMNTLASLRAQGTKPIAIGVGEANPQILAGNAPVQLVPKGQAATRQGALGNDATRDAVMRLYAGQDALSQTFRAGANSRMQTAQTLSADMQDPSMNAQEMLAANNGAGAAQGLLLDAQHLGTLMRQDRNLRLGFMSAGGWDTHANQGPLDGALSRNLGNLASALVQLRRDFSQPNDVVLVCSEFGRTSAENGTRGTDHGHGNAMWLMGNKVQGGRWHGTWTGLAQGNLHEGRDLPVHHDFRAVLAQVLRATQGLGSTQLDRLFPGFAWDQSLDGLMRA
jgi:uncharacterized protein (DUF1501 family)